MYVIIELTIPYYSGFTWFLLRVLLLYRLNYIGYFLCYLVTQEETFVFLFLAITGRDAGIGFWEHLCLNLVWWFTLLFLGNRLNFYSIKSKNIECQMCLRYCAYCISKQIPLYSKQLCGTLPFFGSIYYSISESGLATLSDVLFCSVLEVKSRQRPTQIWLRPARI